MSGAGAGAETVTNPKKRIAEDPVTQTIPVEKQKVQKRRRTVAPAPAPALGTSFFFTSAYSPFPSPEFIKNQAKIKFEEHKKDMYKLDAKVYCQNKEKEFIEKNIPFLSSLIEEEEKIKKLYDSYHEILKHYKRDFVNCERRIQRCKSNIQTNISTNKEVKREKEQRLKTLPVMIEKSKQDFQPVAADVAIYQFYLDNH